MKLAVAILAVVVLAITCAEASEKQKQKQKQKTVAANVPSTPSLATEERGKPTGYRMVEPGSKDYLNTMLFGELVKQPRRRRGQRMLQDNVRPHDNKLNRNRIGKTKTFVVEDDRHGEQATDG